MKTVKLLLALGVCAITSQVMAENSTFIAENKCDELIHEVAAGDFKDVPVRPYIKSDGTVVQGHYRSHPRR